MAENQIMKDIAERAVLYYFSKYTEGHFRKNEGPENDQKTGRDSI